jgi:hypothetical protein
LEYSCRHNAFRPTNLQQKLYRGEGLDTTVEEEGESDDGDEDEEEASVCRLRECNCLN